MQEGYSRGGHLVLDQIIIALSKTASSRMTGRQKQTNKQENPRQTDKIPDRKEVCEGTADLMQFGQVSLTYILPM